MGRTAKREALLVVSEWPTLAFEDAAAADEMNWIVDLVSQVRSVRTEMNVPPGAQVPLALVGTEGVAARVEPHQAAVMRLARISDLKLAPAPEPGTVQVVVGDATACLELSGVIDMAEEKTRLGRELEKVAKEIAKIDAKLENEQFLEKAPIEIIEEQRDRREEAVAHRDKLSAAVERLG